MSEAEFKAWPKTPRLVNDTFIITEKLDGTNGQILIHEDGTIDVGSRSRWLSSGKVNDNFGFYDWIQERRGQIVETLGPGRYYGEFIGKGIQRGYGLDHKRFYLFRIDLDQRVQDHLNVVDIYTVPVIDIKTVLHLDEKLTELTLNKPSSAVHAFPYPEGVIIQSKLTGARWKYFIYEEVPKK